MSSRPRRAAAQRANTAITDMVDSDNHINSRTGRTMSSRTSRRSEGKSAAASDLRGPPSEPSDSNQHIHFTVKLPASKLRQATSSRSGQSARQQPSIPGTGDGKRNRSQKKSYVVDTSDEEEDEAEDEVQVEEDDDEDDDDEEEEDAEGEDDDMADEDAEGEIVVDDTMDIDAEGDDDEDTEGEDDDMDVDQIPPPAPVIKVSKPKAKRALTGKSKASAKSNSKAATSQARDSDDDEELSELESEADEIQDTVKVGGGGEEDAEGEDEEIEATNIAEDDEDDDADSDGGAETPDLTRMTKRQRARFEENGDSLMKLSDEVQAKKHFTAEELSMRRAEMARRRRNLSEKRNEEVKMETINKLLKKQAPKTNRKSQLAGEQTPDVESRKPNPIFVRWVSNKDGSRVAVPEEMLSGPSGRVFVPGGLGSGKMVEEVS
ncbi:PAPA-1-like conserved region-domain-containing protein [Daldinia caldariorum]|uniref:PAPA-1-like conserved region-domain-containing protein n=1 Tax=Daldinia caldariorum TaxID=326644 RepID=UPI00200866BE|nr:PAPA-1-like conserved region-domain-containing protein [Daldinia caldariorum]KAI1471967.1 PAPA-1-like conserved region-domain-containing protein [Daldinia caldariorum]